MLTEKQLEEIREHLENAKNPIFFFDNDADGLASFLILQRFIGRGRGVSLKGLPSLTKAYYRRVEEFNADYIFVLDRPGIDDDFIELNKKDKNLPIVCIDHHQLDGEPKIENYYNTFVTSGKSEPTAYLCYKTTGRKEDLWLAVIGCVGDYFIPEFIGEFEKQYPELINQPYKNPFDIVYNTELGKIIRVLNLALKDSTSNVVSLYKFLMKAQGPKDTLEENSKTKGFLERYELLNKIIQKNLEKAEKSIDKKNKLLFFTYSGEMSLSQDISNELSYKHPDMIIVVGFIKGGHVKFSLRGEKVRTKMVNAIEGLEGAMGGGHEVSCGAQMSAELVPKFKENLIKEIEQERSKGKN